MKGGKAGPVEFAAVNGIKLLDSHKSMSTRWTWKHPRTRGLYELDYFFSDHGLDTSRMKVMEPGFRTDHRMKTVYVRLDRSKREKMFASILRRKGEGRQVRIPYKEMNNDPELRKKFAETVNSLAGNKSNGGQHVGKKYPIRSKEALEGRWREMQSIIMQAANTATPTPTWKRPKYPPWVNVQAAEYFRQEKKRLLDKRFHGDAPARQELNRRIRKITEERKKNDMADMERYLEELVKRTKAEYGRCGRTDYIRLRESGQLNYAFCQEPEKRKAAAHTAEAFAEHFKTLMTRTGEVPQAFWGILNRNAPQLPMIDEWGEPTDEEIQKTIKKSSNGACHIF